MSDSKTSTTAPAAPAPVKAAPKKATPSVKPIIPVRDPKTGQAVTFPSKKK